MPGQYRSGSATGRHAARPIEVLHVGAACRDITADDPRGWRLGGGVTYAALTTARLGLRTAAVMGVDELARSAKELDLLRDAGADLMLVPLGEGPIFENRETPAGRVQTCIAPGRPVPVQTLPESWSAARAWSIAPVAGEVLDDWASAIPDGALVAVAWQGFLRELAAGERVTRRPPQASRLLDRADLVGVSHHDLDPDTPLADLYPLIGPDTRLIVTRGADGGFFLTLGEHGHPIEELRYRVLPSDREVDPTGAGDTFLAALVSSSVRRAVAGRSSGRVDLAFAAAAGSLVVEGHGLAAVPDRAAVLVRMARDRLRSMVEPAQADRVGASQPAAR
jgi:sugar/nucleoside kinase (ribokinase family)